MTIQMFRNLAVVLVAVGAPACAGDELAELEQSLGAPPPAELVRAGYVTHVFSDGTYVYWAEADGEGAFGRVPAAGGPAVRWPTERAPQAVAMDGTHIYWSDGEARVYRRAKTGGAPVLLADLDGEIGDLVVDGTSVYVSKRGWGASVQRLPKTGGKAVTVASNQEDPLELAVDGSAVYWTTLGRGNPAIGCNEGEGKVWRKSKWGLAPVLVAWGDTCPSGLVADVSGLTWAAWHQELHRTGTLGGLKTTLSHDASAVLASDGSTLYYGRASDGALVARSLVGERVIAPAVQPWVIAADVQHVYWVQPILGDEGFPTGETTIRRAAKN
jgi:hypothetical protein